MNKSFLNQDTYTEKNDILSDVTESNYENLMVGNPSLIINNQDYSNSTYKYIFNNKNINSIDKSNIKLSSFKPSQVFKCEVKGCEKVYKSKENLTLHLKNIHLNLKPYKCRFCSSTFSHRNG
jgi:hypothetical protein